MYLKEIGTVPLLSADEELRLAKRKAEGDESAKERLIEANLRLVAKYRKALYRTWNEFPGSCSGRKPGLIKGVEKFDYTKGYKLSTYATWWIRQSVTRALCRSGENDPCSGSYGRDDQQDVKDAEKADPGTGYEPSVTELAEALDMSEDKVMEIMQIAREPASLETPIGEEDDLNLGDFCCGQQRGYPRRKCRVCNAERAHRCIIRRSQRERASGHRASIWS